MIGRGIVFVATIALAIHFGAPGSHAAPGSGSGSGSGSDEIEMEPDNTGSAAQEPVKDPKIAKKWLLAAQQLVAKGDALAKQKKPDEAKQQWDNAVIAYGKAIEAGLDINVYADLAAVEDKLGNLPDAVKHYKLALAAPGVKPAVAKQLTAKLDEALGKVGLVTLVILPEHTKVMLGDKEVGTSPLTEPLVLAPGVYTLALTATGYEPRQAEIKVEAGSESERKIELEPKKAVIQPVEKEPEQPAAKPAATPIWPLYAGAGASGGLLLIGTVTGIIAIGKHGTLTSPTSTKSERADAQSSGPGYAHITDACLVGALAAGAFTAYYYMYKYKPSLGRPSPAAETPVTSKLDIVPWVQPDAGGLVVGGRF